MEVAGHRKILHDCIQDAAILDISLKNSLILLLHVTKKLMTKIHMLMFSSDFFIF